jgi:hypothetical protein
MSDNMAPEARSYRSKYSPICIKNIKSSPKTRKENSLIGLPNQRIHRSQTFSRTPFGPSLIIVFHPLSVLSFLSSIHVLLVVDYSTMNRNNKQDETAIIVATAVVAIMYLKKKRVASVFDQRLCWNRFTVMHGQRCVVTCHVRISFTKLLGYICDSRLVDSDMASLRGGIIAPEIQYSPVHCWWVIL